ncbi:MAG: phosphotransferase [Solirubrobacterales bacterium]|nr:phosphotransferase [Solirubrobacterales bacterium]
MGEPAGERLEEVVAALEAVLGPLSEEPTPLSGGITNHNFRARFGDQDVVLRVAGRDTDLLGIDRDAERSATAAAAGLGIAPPVVAYIREHGCLVTRFVPGSPVDAEELREPACLAAVARALRRFHDEGPDLPTTFDVPAIARAYLATARGRGGTIPGGAREAVAVADRIKAVLRGPEHEPVACHDDLLPANFIRDGDAVWIVDWEYAGMGDRYFDLGNLSVNNGFEEADDARLLDAYWGEPPTPRRLAALRLMRAMSDVREALWGVVQGAVSELDFDFAGYADDHLRRLRATTADPRFEDWLRDAATA